MFSCCDDFSAKQSCYACSVGPEVVRPPPLLPLSRADALTWLYKYASDGWSLRYDGRILMTDYIAKLQAEETHRLMTSKGYVRVDPAEKKETPMTEEPRSDQQVISDIITARTAQIAINNAEQFSSQDRVDVELKKIPKPALWDKASSAVRLAWLHGHTREIKARLGIR